MSGSSCAKQVMALQVVVLSFLELMNILPSTAKEVKVPYGIKFSSQSTLETVDYLGGQNVITVLLRVCKGGRKENTGATI